jgi:hypothetical protein
LAAIRGERKKQIRLVHFAKWILIHHHTTPFFSKCFGKTAKIGEMGTKTTKRA